MADRQNPDQNPNRPSSRTDDAGQGGNSGTGDRATTEQGAAEQGAMTPADGGRMNYGGTDAAYAGMENRNEGDAGDRANAVDRDDMDQPTGATGAMSGGGMSGGTEPGDGMESSRPSAASE